MAITALAGSCGLAFAVIDRSSVLIVLAIIMSAVALYDAPPRFFLVGRLRSFFRSMALCGTAWRQGVHRLC